MTILYAQRSCIAQHINATLSMVTVPILSMNGTTHPLINPLDAHVCCTSQRAAWLGTAWVQRVDPLSPLRLPPAPLRGISCTQISQAREIIMPSSSHSNTQTPFAIHGLPSGECSAVVMQYQQAAYIREDQLQGSGQDIVYMGHLGHLPASHAVSRCTGSARSRLARF